MTETFVLLYFLKCHEVAFYRPYLQFLMRLTIDMTLNTSIRILTLQSSSMKNIKVVKTIITEKEYPYPKHLFRGKEKNVKKM